MPSHARYHRRALGVSISRGISGTIPAFAATSDSRSEGDLTAAPIPTQRADAPPPGPSPGRMSWNAHPPSLVPRSLSGGVRGWGVSGGPTPFLTGRRTNHSAACRDSWTGRPTTIHTSFGLESGVSRRRTASNWLVEWHEAVGLDSAEAPGPVGPAVTSRPPQAVSVSDGGPGTRPTSLLDRYRRFTPEGSAIVRESDIRYLPARLGGLRWSAIRVGRSA